MHLVKDTIEVTTDASGDATEYSEEVFNGRVQNVIYTKDDFAAGVDFTITTELTGQTVWTEADVNASKTVAPRQAVHDTGGVASLYAAAGEPVEDHVCMVDERLKIVIANGGNAKNGSFTVIVG